MKKGYENMEYSKTFLFDLRYHVSWTENQLFNVLKNLKSKKCADPLGMIYDLFKPGIIGQDLFESLLLFCKETKDKIEVIDPIRHSDITSIYKHKGNRFSLTSDRGIFSVVKIRRIIDKLIYQDIYAEVDSNMTATNMAQGKRGTSGTTYSFFMS